MESVVVVTVVFVVIPECLPARSVRESVVSFFDNNGSPTETLGDDRNCNNKSLDKNLPG